MKINNCLPNQAAGGRTPRNSCCTYVGNLPISRNKPNQIVIFKNMNSIKSRAAVVHFNFRVGSTFPVPVCTVPCSIDRTSRCNKVNVVRLYASYRMNLLLLKRKRVREIDLNPQMITIINTVSNLPWHSGRTIKLWNNKDEFQF